MFFKQTWSWRNLAIFKIIATMSKAKLKATWACIKVMPHFLSMKKCHKRLMSVRRQSVKLQPQHKMTIYSLTFSSALDTAWNYTKKKNQIVIWIQNMELKKFLIFPGCLWRGQQLSSVDLCIQIRKQRTHPWRDASHFKIFQKKKSSCLFFPVDHRLDDK